MIDENSDKFKEEVDIDELSKIDVRTGTITQAENVEGSNKLIKLMVDFGKFGTRQILTGMQQYYSPEELVGMQTTFIVNLKPRKMLGLESQGMIFAVDGEKPIFLVTKDKSENGASII